MVAVPRQVHAAAAGAAAGAAASVEAGAIRAVLGLPTTLLRRVAGEPITRDGQRLDTETQVVLKMMALSGKPDPGSLGVPEGRAALLAQTTSVGGRQPIAETRDLTAGGRPARLYVPGGRPPGPDPLLVFFHGGGFMHGDLETHDAPCRYLAERAGVRVLSVDYRLGPEAVFPAAHDDAFAAYEWVLDHADELGADRDRIGVGGDSAGGNLAAAVAIQAARSGWPCKVQVLVYPATDCVDRSGYRSYELFAEGFYLTKVYMELANESYAPDPAVRGDWRLSPVLMDPADLPDDLAPALVATAGFDPLRDEGEAYARKLADAGVEVQLTRYPDLVHGFFNIVGVGRQTRAVNAEIATRVGNALRRDPEPADDNQPDSELDQDPTSESGSHQPGTDGERDASTGLGSAELGKG